MEPEGSLPPSPGSAPRDSGAGSAAEFRRFLLLFVVYRVGGNLLLLLPAVKTWFVTPWTSLNARWAVGLTGAFGVDLQALDTLVYTGGANVSVKPGCNGVHALMLCLSAILAYPATWSRRMVGVVLATVGVFGLNLVRLVNLFLIARLYPEQLELFHVYIWQTLIALLAFGIFLFWGRFLASTEPAPSPTGNR